MFIIYDNKNSALLFDTKEIKFFSIRLRYFCLQLTKIENQTIGLNNRKFIITSNKVAKIEQFPGTTDTPV